VPHKGRPVDKEVVSIKSHQELNDGAAGPFFVF